MTPSFTQVEFVVAEVRKALFDRAINGAEWEEKFLPFTWMIERHSKGDYVGMFKAWDSGKESMRGKCLFQRCNELLGFAE